MFNKKNSTQYCNCRKKIERKKEKRKIKMEKSTFSNAQSTVHFFYKHTTRTHVLILNLSIVREENERSSNETRYIQIFNFSLQTYEIENLLMLLTKNIINNSFN